MRSSVNRWRRVAATAGLAVLLLGSASSAWAQACPGSTVTLSSSLAGRYGTGTVTSMFVSASSSCSAVPFGAANGCLQYGGPMAGRFNAFWPSATARTMDASGGCSFMCPGGTCVVRNDGLPVELLQFGVE